MKKSMFVFAFCAVAVTGFGTETYDATTGYVTFSGDWVKGFASEAGWSDGLAPHSGTNYYIGAGNSLSADSSAQNKTFQGDRLVVAGSVFHGVSGGYTVGWCPVEFLPGATYVFYSVGSISTEAAWTVSATEDKPFRMRYSRALKAGNPKSWQFLIASQMPPSLFCACQFSANSDVILDACSTSSHFLTPLIIQVDSRHPPTPNRSHFQIICSLYYGAY